MRPGIRLLLASSLTLALAIGLLLAWVDITVREDLTRFTRDELGRDALMVADAVGTTAFSDSLADALASKFELRVTLISNDGTVIGDSDVPTRGLPAVENHGDRPEVLAAHAEGEGFATRTSATVNRQLYYFAVLRPQGIVRVATSTQPIAAIVESARRSLLAGTLLALVLALVLGRGVANAYRRALGDIRGAIESIARGKAPPKLDVSYRGELGALGRAADELGSITESAIGNLRREKADLDALFESLDDGLAVLDAEGSVLRANSAFRTLVGREEPEGERVSTLFRSPELRATVDDALAGRAESSETRLRDQTYHVSATPHAGGALLVVKDLTPMRRLQDVRRDFVANVSHELKTPLTAVMGFAEPISEGGMAESETAAFGQRILDNAKRMRRLVDDLLDLSRIEAGSWQPRPELVDIRAAARESWGSLRPEPSERDLRLAVVPDEPHRAVADPDAVAQILRNLLENAARYAPDGSTVTVRVLSDDGMKRIEVTDTGPGIPPVHQARVFERFYRADPARSRQEGGTGLGLAIVKHLVAAHGGDVGLESDIGAGTTVWFTLPVGTPSGFSLEAGGEAP